MTFPQSIKSSIECNILPGHTAHQQMMRHLQRPSFDLAPDNARISAVLLYLFEKENQIYGYFIQRITNQSVHSGQISLPGGQADDEDIDLIHTAIRETREEINLMVDREEILGCLTPIYIPVSNFIVYPYIAFGQKGIDVVANPDEVYEVFSLSMDALFRNKTQRQIHNAEISYQVQAYGMHDDLFIWGATAMILAEVEVLWQQYYQAQ